MPGSRSLSSPSLSTGDDCVGEKTAYVVVAIDVSKDIPRFAGVGIVIEDPPTTKIGTFVQWCPLQLTGTDFQDAYDKVMQTCMTHPSYAWLKKWILLSPAEQKKLLEGR